MSLSKEIVVRNFKDETVLEVLFLGKIHGRRLVGCCVMVHEKKSVLHMSEKSNETRIYVFWNMVTIITPTYIHTYICTYIHIYMKNSERNREKGRYTRQVVIRQRTHTEKIEKM